ITRGLVEGPVGRGALVAKQRIDGGVGLVGASNRVAQLDEALEVRLLVFVEQTEAITDEREMKRERRQRSERRAEGVVLLVGNEPRRGVEGLFDEVERNPSYGLVCRARSEERRVGKG